MKTERGGEGAFQAAARHIFTTEACRFFKFFLMTCGAATQVKRYDEDASCDEFPIAT